MGPDPYYRWICVNEAAGEAHVAGYRTIFTAGTVYALLITGMVIVGTLQANKQKNDKIIS